MYFSRNYFSDIGIAAGLMISLHFIYFVYVVRLKDESDNFTQLYLSTLCLIFLKCLKTALLSCGPI